MTDPAGRPAILVPAAGASSRMRGRDKLMEPVRGRPLLAERVATAAATGALVIVTLPPRELAPARWAALDDARVHLVAVAEPGLGLAESFKAGLAALPAECPALMILPADMPDLTTADLDAVFAAADGEAILRGSGADGRPGHPVLFPARDFPALCRLSGDSGGRAVVEAAGSRVRLVPLPGANAYTDLDTPEDWARWRRR